MAAARAAAALLIQDPESSQEITPDRLEALYGFSPAEVRVAMLLAEGSIVLQADQAGHEDRQDRVLRCRDRG